MKEATFYCENCGKLVSIEEDICPSCHNAFQAVRCPVCSFTGQSALFLNGCPSCGYLTRDEKTEKPRNRIASSKVKSERLPLPKWLFPIIAVILIVIITVFAVMLLR